MPYRSITGLSVVILVLRSLEACDSESTTESGSLPDANISLDSSSDTQTNPPEAASEAAAADQKAPDASDGGPQLNSLYSSIGGKLVSLDVANGTVSDVGTHGYTYLTMAWDNNAKIARVLVDLYSPVGGAATPKLGTINLCTGAVTVGPNITIASTQVRRAEGLAQDPATGTFYISVGTTGTTGSTEFLTEIIGSIDVTSGAVTVLGNHQTLQDDGDGLGFVGGVLHLNDIASGTNQGAVYAIDKTNATAVKVVDVGPKLLRFNEDTSRGLVFAVYGEPNFTARGLATLNLTTGALAKIGADLPNSAYAGANFTAIASLPKPVCP